MKPWFARWRHHPGCIIGHILWGLLAGGVGGIAGAMLLCGGWAYQFGSGWRKAERGQIDTVGLDAFDYALGYAAGTIGRMIAFGW